jgi:hypothetical protein
MDNTMEILKAKAEAVRALADALAKAVQTGQVGGPDSAVAFAGHWASAIESMIPQPTECEAEDEASLKDLELECCCCC